MIMTLTHASRNDQGDATFVYRDLGAQIAVTHRSAHRGGCLYTGTVTVFNQNTGDGYTFTSTAAPGEITAQGAAAYATKHAARISAPVLDPDTEYEYRFVEKADR